MQFKSLSLLVFIILLVGSPIGAQQKSTLLIETFPKIIPVAKPLILKPLADHHFNTKAPNRCGDEKPTQLSEKTLTCVFNSVGNYKIIASVCDDANTFCKIERLDIEVTAK